MTDIEILSAQDLRVLPFPSAFGQLVRAKATGVLEIQDAMGTNRAFFLNGIPQGAKLSRLKNPLGRILVNEGVLTEHDLDQALNHHNKTDKLLGQVFLEMGLVDQAILDQVMATQSRLNFLSLFGTVDGRLRFEEGLVHLTDFSAAPMSPLRVLYEGVRDHSREEITFPVLARLALTSVKASADTAELASELPPAEQMAVQLLSELRFTGDLARRVPLPAAALGALLFALHELGGLEVGAANDIPHS